MIKKTTEKAQNVVPVMLSIRETADRFNIPVHLVRTLVAYRKIYAIQAGTRKFYVNEESVADYLSGRGWFDQQEVDA